MIKVDEFVCIDPIEYANTLPDRDIVNPLVWSCNGIWIPQGKYYSVGYFLLPKIEAYAISNRTSVTVYMESFVQPHGKKHIFIGGLIPLGAPIGATSKMFTNEEPHIVTLVDRRYYAMKSGVTINRKYNTEVYELGWKAREESLKYDAAQQNYRWYSYEEIARDLWQSQLNDVFSIDDWLWPVIPELGTSTYPKQWDFSGWDAYEAINTYLNWLGLAITYRYNALVPPLTITAFGHEEAQAVLQILLSLENHAIHVDDNMGYHVGQMPINTKVVYQVMDRSPSNDFRLRKDAHITETVKPMNPPGIVAASGVALAPSYGIIKGRIVGRRKHTGDGIENNTELNNDARIETDLFYRRRGMWWYFTIKGSTKFARPYRVRNLYLGVHYIPLIGFIKGVAFRQDSNGGLVTEVFVDPCACLKVREGGGWEEVCERVDVKTKEPDKPIVVQVLSRHYSPLKCDSLQWIGRTFHTTRHVYVYSGKIANYKQKSDNVAQEICDCEWFDDADVWVLDVNGMAVVPGRRYLARYSGWLEVGGDGRPLVIISMDEQAHVLVTSDYPDANGYYTGIVQFFDTTSKTWIDLFECKVKDINDN